MMPLVLGQTTLSEQLAEMAGLIFDFLPKLFAAILIGVSGFIAAKLIANVLDGLLHRAGFNQAVMRLGLQPVFQRSDHDASQTVARIVSYLVMLFAAQLAFAAFGANPASESLQRVIAFLPRVLAAVLIVLVAGVIAGALRDVVSATLSGISYGQALANITAALIAGVGIFAALDQLQIAPAIILGLYYTALAIIAGSAMLAIGGSGIGPLRTYWERVLSRTEDASQELREELQDRPAEPAAGGGQDEAGRS
ncbi:MAG: mechanosensitive ion channel family protein [Egibacteraceae bacterium]